MKRPSVRVLRRPLAIFVAGSLLSQPLRFAATQKTKTLPVVSPVESFRASAVDLLQVNNYFHPRLLTGHQMIATIKDGLSALQDGVFTMRPTGFVKA